MRILNCIHLQNTTDIRNFYIVSYVIMKKERTRFNHQIVFKMYGKYLLKVISHVLTA